MIRRVLIVKNDTYIMQVQTGNNDNEEIKSFRKL